MAEYSPTAKHGSEYSKSHYSPIEIEIRFEEIIPCFTSTKPQTILGDRFQGKLLLLQ